MDFRPIHDVGRQHRTIRLIIYRELETHQQCPALFYKDGSRWEEQIGIGEDLTVRQNFAHIFVITELSIVI